MDFKLCEQIKENISQVIVGKHQTIELLLVALLGNGHVLLEDVPGLGKTLIANLWPGASAGLLRGCNSHQTCFLQI